RRRQGRSTGPPLPREAEPPEPLRNAGPWTSAPFDSPPSIALRDALQILRRADDRPPHMRDRTVIEAQALFGLAEVAADDVGELVELDMQVGIERVDIVQGDLPARHVPFVIAHPLVVLLDVGIELVVLAEQSDVGLRIFIADRLVGIEAQ